MESKLRFSSLTDLSLDEKKALVAMLTKVRRMQSSVDSSACLWL